MAERLAGWFVGVLVVTYAAAWAGLQAERVQARPAAKLEVDLLKGTVNGEGLLGKTESECRRLFGAPEDTLAIRDNFSDDKTLFYSSQGFWVVLVRDKGASGYRFHAFLACTRDLAIDFGKNKVIRIRAFTGSVTPEPMAMSDKPHVAAAFPTAEVLEPASIQLGHPNPATWHEAREIWVERQDLDVGFYIHAQDGQVIGFSFGRAKR
jgi:hypothetical protein